MKTLFLNLIVPFFLIASGSDCFGETVLREITVEQARDLGVVIQSKKHADERIWISLELSATGEWERFRRVDLVVKSGGADLIAAPLKATSPRPGIISVGFFAHSSTLADCELQVVVDSRGSIVSRFKLRDFVNVEEISTRAAQKKSINAEQGGAHQSGTRRELKSE